MVDVSLPRDARPSERLEATFRLECPEGHVRFAILGGNDLRRALEGKQVRRRCAGCTSSVRFDVISPDPSEVVGP